MNCIDARITKQAVVAAFALTRLTLFILNLLILTAGAARPLQAQTESDQTQAPIVNHNEWTIGAPLPTPVWFETTGVLEGQIYVVGGALAYPATKNTAETQIYNPVTNTWSIGVSLPTPTSAAAGAVVNNILYVIGGYTTKTTNAVVAYSPNTKTWTAKAPMPAARNGCGGGREQHHLRHRRL